MRTLHDALSSKVTLQYALFLADIPHSTLLIPCLIIYAVIATLLNFVRMFRKAHEENCKQAELEKKKARKEAEVENTQGLTRSKRARNWVECFLMGPYSLRWRMHPTIPQLCWKCGAESAVEPSGNMRKPGGHWVLISSEISSSEVRVESWNSVGCWQVGLLRNMLIARWNLYINANPLLRINTNSLV